MLRTLIPHRVTNSLKAALYQRRGEPIQYGDLKLRYLPGTRPVRLNYRDDDNSNVRIGCSIGRCVREGHRF